MQDRPLRLSTRRWKWANYALGKDEMLEYWFLPFRIDLQNENA